LLEDQKSHCTNEGTLKKSEIIGQAGTHWQTVWIAGLQRNKFRGKIKGSREQAALQSLANRNKYLAHGFKLTVANFLGSTPKLSLHIGTVRF
jgi:hypothetical protein